MYIRNALARIVLDRSACTVYHNSADNIISIGLPSNFVSRSSLLNSLSFTNYCSSYSPRYLASLVSFDIPFLSLCSSNARPFAVPKVRLQIATCSFCVACPTILNSLLMSEQLLPGPFSLLHSKFSILTAHVLPCSVVYSYASNFTLFVLG
jgi:hypothetical protein